MEAAGEHTDAVRCRDDGECVLEQRVGTLIVGEGHSVGPYVTDDEPGKAEETDEVDELGDGVHDSEHALHKSEEQTESNHHKEETGGTINNVP